MVDKRTGHEPSLRIPLVVRYPNLIDEGRVIDAQTLTLDFASTILEICNAEPLPTTQGKSWKKLVSREILTGEPVGTTSTITRSNFLTLQMRGPCGRTDGNTSATPMGMDRPTATWPSSMIYRTIPEKPPI